jgi:hypothetical protein
MRRIPGRRLVRESRAPRQAGAVGQHSAERRRTVSQVEFSKELREDVLSGEITVSFRLWRRPKVSPGRRYPVGPGWIEVDSIELVPFSSIDEDDVRQTGETDLDALRRRAAHAGPIGDDTVLYRIEFHTVQ